MLCNNQSQSLVYGTTGVAAVVYNRLGVWCAESVFDELGDQDLAAVREAVGDGALQTARLAAATRLLAGPATGVVADPPALVELLMRRDTADPRWERLGAFELRWSLLVLRLVDGVLTFPIAAVADARRRGATWPAVADVLGVSAQAAGSRFRAVGGGKRGRPRRS